MKTSLRKLNTQKFLIKKKEAERDHAALRKNLQLIREREIEAIVELTRNEMVDRYEDVIAGEFALSNFPS